jgi:hypothetical protein
MVTACGDEIMSPVMAEEKNQSWVDDASALVDSWWGAVAALMVLQAYGFILLQALVHLFNHHGKYDSVGAVAFAPIVIVFLFVFALSQAGGLRVMNSYLRTHDWRMAFRFWHSAVETLRFLAAILCTGVYVYLLTGGLPLPRDPALYRDLGILYNLMFQSFGLAVSLLANWLWKLSPKIAAMRGIDINDPELKRMEARNGIIGTLLAIPMGIVLVVVSCYAKEFFYIAGVIGYGMIAVCLSVALSRSPKEWGATS